MAIHEQLCLQQVVLKECICVFLSKIAEVDGLTFKTHKKKIGKKKKDPKMRKHWHPCGSVTEVLGGRPVIIRKHEMRGKASYNFFSPSFTQ